MPSGAFPKSRPISRPRRTGLANKAAEEVAAYESQFTAIKVDLAGIKGDVALLKWMLALLVGGVASLVTKAFV